MEIANIHEAKSQLSKLVDRALAGEEIIIARAGTPVVRLVPVNQDDSPRQGGQWKGKVRIAPDFDELPDDIAHPFGIDAESSSASRSKS
jgi:prevent-host-death family protein